jgi:hypothetical protein
MVKTTLAIALVTLSSLGWMQERRRPAVPLKEGRMTIESMAGGEVVVRIEAESEEELQQVRIKRPGGESFLELQSGNERGLSGLMIELRETSLQSLLASYTEGDYGIRATNVSGVPVVGSAHLSFDLPAAPRLYYPPSGATGVDASSLNVTWLADRRTESYFVQLEQGETDLLAVNLPASRNSLRVPPGILARGVETRLEIAAIAPNGNRTAVETVFTTQP